MATSRQLAGPASTTWIRPRRCVYDPGRDAPDAFSSRHECTIDASRPGVCVAYRPRRTHAHRWRLSRTSLHPASREQLHAHLSFATAPPTPACYFRRLAAKRRGRSKRNGQRGGKRGYASASGRDWACELRAPVPVGASRGNRRGRKCEIKRAEVKISDYPDNQNLYFPDVY
ncbi:hypothetical protein PUN28_016816 [Cardiocondyla obscurior]|uniref:Uncharacterized protein n=1 Tax=Cardiocondyla obscurior TaxID=286306 RepID=A0AAW2EQL0_9HYME